MKSFSTPTRSSLPTRSKKKISIPSTKLNEIKSHFDSCVTEIRKRFLIFDVLSAGTATDDEIAASEDILRFQLISIDSIFEFYMHRILVYGIRKMFNEEWEKTSQYNKITVKLPIVEAALLNPEDTKWIEELSEEFRAKDTFMSAEMVKEALKTIGIKFDEISMALGYTSPTDLTEKLNQIYKRRTSIVHYADIDTSTKVKNSIVRSFVEDAINTIEKFCEQVFIVIEEKEKVS